MRECRGEQPVLLRVVEGERELEGREREEDDEMTEKPKFARDATRRPSQQV